MGYITDSVAGAGGGDELCEPAVAYCPRPRAVAGPWTAVPAAAGGGGYRYGYDGEALPAGWDEELEDNPEILAELDRRIAKSDAAMAAGTWVGYSVEEAFAQLKREFPHLWGLSNG